MIDFLTETFRWLAIVFAVIACYYSIRFIIRYRRVNWEAYPWGRHVMRFSLLIAVAMALAVILRALAYFGLTNMFILSLIGAVIYGWVAYEMRRRFYLEKESQEEQMRRRAAFEKE